MPKFPKEPMGPTGRQVVKQLGDVGALTEADAMTARKFTRAMDTAAQKAGISAAVRKTAKRGF